MEGADFFVEDLLDLSNGGDDFMATDAAFYHHHSSAAAGGDSSAVVTPVDSSNSSLSPSFPDSHFPADLCIPYEDTAELEWLSNFVEESFSSDDLHNHPHYLPNPTHFHNPTRQPTHNPNPNPAQPTSKARSKRSRVAPHDWSTRLLMVSPATSSSENPNPGPNQAQAQAQRKPTSKKREPNNNNGDNSNNGEVRRCLHCAAEKTPQWRTGPMGPKTLCNACGVRYKSGRLVPEYRPAASPTFVSTKHSNSHRKVVELRRQKELQQQQQHFMHHHQHQHQQHHHHQQQHQQRMMMAGVSNGGDDFLIHHHHHLGGHDYRQMI